MSKKILGRGTGYYSYFRFNLENSVTLSSHSLNGGGADVTHFFSKIVGIEAEFGGYQSNSVTYTNGSTVATASANLVTYNVGPVFKFRKEHFEPFAEALFGGAHSSFYGNLCKALEGCGVNNPSNNAFDFVIGGGLDIPLSHSIAFRPVPGRLSVDPVWQRIYLRKPEPKQFPVSGRDSVPDLIPSGEPTPHC